MSIRYQKARRQIDIKSLHGINFPDHIHDEVELIYVEKGNSIISIDNHVQELTTGDFAIVFPNTIHKYQLSPNLSEDSNHCIVAIIPLKLCGTHLNTLLNESPLDPFILKADLHPNVAFAMRQLLEESLSEYSPAVCQALVELVLARTLPQLTLTKIKQQESSDLIEQIIRYINQHFKEDLTLYSLSVALGVSKYHLSHIISDTMHTHFRRYLNTIRANYTSVQIRTTNRPLTQIWNEAGFESQRTFNRAFKEIYGMTPSEYRKNHNKIKQQSIDPHNGL